MTKIEKLLKAEEPLFDVWAAEGESGNPLVEQLVDHVERSIMGRMLRFKRSVLREIDERTTQTARAVVSRAPQAKVSALAILQVLN